MFFARMSFILYQREKLIGSVLQTIFSAAYITFLKKINIKIFSFFHVLLLFKLFKKKNTTKQNFLTF